MPGGLKEAAKRLMPSGLLSAVRRTRWWFRESADRRRWRATGRPGRNIGLEVVDGYRVAYRIGSVDNEVVGQSFGHDIFFAAIPEFTLRQDAVVVDIGAHIGAFSLLSSKKAPRGKVFAIEASQETFDLLRVNVELNGAANVHLDHLAMAGTDGVVQLHHDPDGNYGHTITRSLSSTSESVEAMTLAHYFESRGIDAVDLVKFNCEGAEFPILLAAPAVVLRRIEKMIVLYHCDLVDRSAAELTAHLNASGFATRVINQTADRGWIIATRGEPGG